MTLCLFLLWMAQNIVFCCLEPDSARLECLQNVQGSLLNPNHCLAIFVSLNNRTIFSLVVSQIFHSSNCT